MHFNPRAPCGARRNTFLRSPQIPSISIHAPHAGRDDRRVRAMRFPRHFNPRAPCGARQPYHFSNEADMLFQSTRPMRGATLVRYYGPDYDNLFQSTRPMRGATSDGAFSVHTRKYFNPRAPCGARLSSTMRSSGTLIFQSTRPMRGATAFPHDPVLGVAISIHAPHAGRDSKSIQNYFTHFCDKRQFLDNFTQNAAF